jgi:hypothetical protein
MVDKMVIITGGNHGLGFECARQIATDYSWHILLACRDLETVNMLFAYEPVRRLATYGLSYITVNAYDPGAVPGTALTREYNPLVKVSLRTLRLLGLFGLRVYSSATSGVAMARLALDPALTGVTGKYFRNKD